MKLKDRDSQGSLLEKVLGNPERDARFFGWTHQRLRVQTSLRTAEAARIAADAISTEDPYKLAVMH